MHFTEIVYVNQAFIRKSHALRLKNVMSFDVKPIAVNFFDPHTLAISFISIFSCHLHKCNSSSYGFFQGFSKKNFFSKYDLQAPRNSHSKSCYCLTRKCILIYQAPNPSFFFNVPYSEPCNI